MKTLFLVVALLISSGHSCQSSMSKNDNANNLSPDSNTKVEQTRQRETESEREKFRVIPGGFKQVDFKNFSYPYRLSDRKLFNIALKNGEHELEVKDGGGWFSYKDTYYVDLTTDGNPEAITILWHVSCGGSCDGGAALFYIYASHQHKLKHLWQYETGSLAYGCGLKSFTVKNRIMTIELFGRCLKEGDESSGSGKFLVKDETHLTFRFNGRRFVEDEKEYTATPERDVKGYEPEVSINE